MVSAMNADNHDSLLREQIAYYQARAGEYDEWFFRRGRYDRGPELNGRWFNEVDILRRALGSFKPAGDILELCFLLIRFTIPPQPLKTIN
jgi:hypothetical protein